MKLCNMTPLVDLYPAPPAYIDAKLPSGQKSQSARYYYPSPSSRSHLTLYYVCTHRNPIGIRRAKEFSTTEVFFRAFYADTIRILAWRV